MAAALFNWLANPKRARAISAGMHPGTEIHPEVVIAMREIGVDLSNARPQYLSSDICEDAHILITMGREEWPLVPGLEHEDWPLDDPEDQPIQAVRRIRDDIKTRVLALIKERNWT
jgi:protein-tyrosine-phosphatase